MRTAADKSDWKDGFLFVGNELVLDFLNTRPIQNGEPFELLTDFGALLRWFRAANVLNPQEFTRLQNQWCDTPKAKRITESMRALREDLRKEILAWEHGDLLRRSTINELNRLMSQHAMRTRLTVHGNSYSTELWFELHEPEDLFAPLVHSAVKLFAEVHRKRVRKCDQCVLHFHDLSKKGTRRWCSMQLCGNRLKVAAYAARQRRHAHK
ncbi:MAG TPA: ABATE domain-containing protein [Terriglobales bacterium]|nr:ABATE domain-containing protein [Terriglobales bacterium]